MIKMNHLFNMYLFLHKNLAVTCDRLLCFQKAIPDDFFVYLVFGLSNRLSFADSSARGS